MNEFLGLSIPEGLSEVLVPSRCAVVIYDMQKGIVPQIPDGNEIAGRCRELLDAARRSGFRIFFTRHFFLPNAAAGVGQFRRAMVWQKKTTPEETRPFIAQGSEAGEIVSELAPADGEVVIDKITMSAFESTFLNLAMRDAHLDSFVIAGIALEVGIGPTVRHGLDLNLCPVLALDACGSKNLEVRQHVIADLQETGEVYSSMTAGILEVMNRHGEHAGA
jgi:biuret amidohydrolase